MSGINLELRVNRSEVFIILSIVSWTMSSLNQLHFKSNLFLFVWSPSAQSHKHSPERVRLKTQQLTKSVCHGWGLLKKKKNISMSPLALSMIAVIAYFKCQVRRTGVALYLFYIYFVRWQGNHKINIWLGLQAQSFLFSLSISQLFTLQHEIKLEKMYSIVYCINQSSKTQS